MREKKRLSSILEQAHKARQDEHETAVPKSTQVYGPYPDGDKWRVVLRDASGHRVSKTLDSREDAEAFMRDVTRQVASMIVPRTIGEALAVDGQKDPPENDRRAMATAVVGRAGSGGQAGSNLPDWEALREAGVWAGKS